MNDGPEIVRLDRWLVFARFFKTRSLAAKVIGEGRVRVNQVRVTKPAASVKPGDVLTFAQGRAIRVVEVTAVGNRRGPAEEAQQLYADQSPPQPPRVPAAPRFDGGGRPSKKDRRALPPKGSGLG